MKVFWVVDPHSKKSIGYYQLGAVVRFILIAVPIVNTIMMIIAFLSLAYNFER